ncbi:hypothetical protein T11_15181 [Trichinella zimbabwensis]|uniref:Uncharacterized protein n=1 Tax=Trichinella zimbabwensis TaxID=268475 RepID=A0A0V1HR77_9BILA|nr:hypothetical protein T11_15181 [Trichinella zimbabwensis]
MTERHAVQWLIGTDVSGHKGPSPDATRGPRRRPATRGVSASPSFSVVLGVLPRAAASHGTASAGRSEPLVSAFRPSSPSPGTYSSPVSSGLRTDRPSTLPTWSWPGLASTPGRLVHTQVRGLSGPSRTSGAVVPGLPFLGPPRRAALGPVADAGCTLLLIPLVRPSRPLVAAALGRRRLGWG